jgi:hypothetical protein
MTLFFRAVYPAADAWWRSQLQEAEEIILAWRQPLRSRVLLRVSLAISELIICGIRIIIIMRDLLLRIWLQEYLICRTIIILS